MRTRTLVAIGACLVGAVWLAQGLGLLPGSGFMDGDLRWAVAGAVLLGLGLATAISVWRTRGPT
jgi:hypothetical protein